MSANIGQGRALAACEICGGVDDHPKHGGVHAGGGDPNIATGPTDEMVNKVLDSTPKDQVAQVLRQLNSVSITEHHYDCGRDAGCELCTLLADGAKGTGKAMLAHIEARKAKFDDPGIVWAEAGE